MKMRHIAELSIVKASLPGAPDNEVRRVTVASPQSGPNVAFYALPGRRTDGHRFAHAALAAGAPAAFVSDAGVFAALAESVRAGQFGPPERRPGVFHVEPGRAALAALVQALYESPSERLSLFGVTGTNGKATVTFLIAQMLGALGFPCGILGGLGRVLPGRVVPSDRTTPEAPDIAEFLALCLAEGVTHAALEISSIGLLEERTGGLRFRCAAFTNLTQDHLDYHSTMAAYRAAKERLFVEYPIGGAVLNADDPVAAELAPRLRAERPAVAVLTFGLAAAADVFAEAPRLTPLGTAGFVRHGDARFPFTLPLPGRFNVSNWLAAASVLLNAGHSLERVAAAAARCTGAPGRLERVPLAAPFTVLVDYAHSPDALANVLAAVRPLAPGRVIVLFGCGGDRDRDKRPQMGAIAERLADLVILTTDNPRSEDPKDILAQILGGMRGTPAPRTIVDRAEAIHAALGAARAGDLVLLAGKGAETTQEIAGRKLPFDDREVVKAWGRARG
jgi:UDP-N-acetylmuramoyl-L-alanyl-D-glutamate--2,6-diaminopimelate ligase